MKNLVPVAITATGGVATVQWNGTALWLLNYIQ